jgi:6-hydroxytryprostatin B O-methyltransferase
MEMTMWNMVNAQERTRQEWEEVVRLTDDRLAILSINRPENSWDSLIEIGWK